MDLALFKSFEDKKKHLIQLQWLVVLATSYLMLFEKEKLVEDPLALFLVLLFLASIVVLYRLPKATFDHRFFAPALVVTDTVFITLAIGLNKESPWDLLLLFYFGLFIAAIGQSLVKIVVGCSMISIISVLISSGMDPSRIDSDTLFRIPFIFGASMLYAYLSEQARKEKRQAEKAKETENLKRQLVSALAHDIKNPLWIIMGSAETAASGLKDSAGNRQYLDALQRIQDNSQRIVKLVTGFLDASKAEVGKMEIEPQPVQLNALLRGMAEQQSGELSRKNISLEMDLKDQLPTIMGDEAQIDRVLWNLLSNAIKFTPKGGTITLSSNTENGKVRVSVRDTGIGMPREEIPLLFAEFRRRKGMAKVEGTGLGLFIVKTIVEAHGGTVEADSEEDRGSTFTVRFPIRLS
jgi:signal transduction histidine kinase